MIGTLQTEQKVESNRWRKGEGEGGGGGGGGGEGEGEGGRGGSNGCVHKPAPISKGGGIYFSFQRNPDCMWVIMTTICTCTLWSLTVYRCPPLGHAYFVLEPLTESTSIDVSPSERTESCEGREGGAGEVGDVCKPAPFPRVYPREGGIFSGWINAPTCLLFSTLCQRYC